MVLVSSDPVLLKPTAWLRIKLLTVWDLVTTSFSVPLAEEVFIQTAVFVLIALRQLIAKHLIRELLA